jgi:hypothetical protein
MYYFLADQNYLRYILIVTDFCKESLRRFLVNQSISINSKSIAKLLAGMLSLGQGERESGLIEAVLRFGPDVEYRDEHGSTFLRIPFSWDDQEVDKILPFSQDNPVKLWRDTGR